MSREEIENNSAKEAPTLGAAECRIHWEVEVRGSAALPNRAASSVPPQETGSTMQVGSLGYLGRVSKYSVHVCRTQRFPSMPLSECLLQLHIFSHFP